MISNLLDKNIAKILACFLISPGSKYTRKELKERTEMNNIPLDNNLNKLLSLKIIKKEKNLLILNFESEFKDILEKIKKEFVELNLPLKIYYILLDLTEKLSEIKQIKEVFLFGSYAKLIYHEKSDIDMAVIFDNKTKNQEKTEKKIEKTAEKTEKKNEIKIEIHFFLEKEMKAKDLLIKDILKNGKKLI